MDPVAPSTFSTETNDESDWCPIRVTTMLSEAAASSRGELGAGAGAGDGSVAEAWEVEEGLLDRGSGSYQDAPQT